MTTIYMIRHAEAEGNLYRIAQGKDNSILTDRGWKQVALLRERFAQTHIDAVYSSDLYRTCATSSALFEPRNLPLLRRPGLREIDVGPWERCTWGDIAMHYPQELYAFTHKAQDYHLEGAESFESVQERVEQAIRTIAADHPNETVAAFSHGYAIRLFLAKLQGYTLETMNQTPHGDNTAVTKLEIDGDTITVVYRDDASHIAPLNHGKQRATSVQPGLYFRSVSPAILQEELGVSVEHGTMLLGRQVDGTPVGFVQLVDGVVAQLGLLPAMREKGYGAQLLGQAVVHCRDAGLDVVQLSTENMDETIFPFLSRYGFTQAEPRLWVKSIGYDVKFL